MKRRQQGVSLSGLLMAAVVLAAVALLGMKVAPEYIEYFQIKKALKVISNDPAVRESVAEVRKAFDRQATMDNIKNIKGDDLEVTKEGGTVLISFAYESRIALFSNVSLLIDFQGSSRE